MQRLNVVGTWKALTEFGLSQPPVEWCPVAQRYVSPHGDPNIVYAAYSPVLRYIKKSYHKKNKHWYWYEPVYRPAPRYVMSAEGWHRSIKTGTVLHFTHCANHNPANPATKNIQSLWLIVVHILAPPTGAGLWMYLPSLSGVFQNEKRGSWQLVGVNY